MQRVVYSFETRKPCGCDFPEGKLWEPLEIMIKFDLPRLTLLMYRLTVIQEKYEQRVTSGEGGQWPVQEEADLLVVLINDLKQYGGAVGFEEIGIAALILESRLSNRPELHDSSAIATELRSLSTALSKDMHKNQFVQVRDELAKYAHKKEPFGKEVNDNFPSAVDDLIEAGNCLAMELNTAAAFHLMRAAEVGLWELGRDRQIPLAQSRKLEFTEWGVIISELEAAVKAIQQWPNSQVKEEAHRFYNAVVVEIRAFNDGWRRHSAHARPNMPRMETDEAIALWGHVFRFMNKLATKIGEGRYTSLVWV